MTPAPPTYRGIAAFWLPMAATWLMMSLEGSFLAAVIARLGDPTPNLAAFGVAFSLALILEAPVIMMLSASTALVEDADSLSRLRRFSNGLGAAVTAIQAAIVATPLFDLLTRDAMDLPAEVAGLTRLALLLLLPWPWAIGYRRLYQGLLIRDGATRRVAYGTVVRMLSMAATALLAPTLTPLSGASVGALALTVGVLAEAVAARVMARRVAARLAATDRVGGEPLRLGRIVEFYAPLAMTSFIGLAIHPLVTFFMGHSRLALESLAVFPVVNSLSFIFRAAGLSYQEVAIALLARSRNAFPAVRGFAVMLGLAASAGLAAIAWTPLSSAWFEGLSGLSPELAAVAVLPARILTPLPFLSVILSLQRAILVDGRRTAVIGRGTAAEVASIVGLLWAGVALFDMVGVVAATAAFIGGRLVGNAWVTPACLTALRSSGRAAPDRVLP